jgi:hypothetical protein
MPYVIFGLKFDILFEKMCEKYNKKLIENCHVENVIFRKTFNLGATSSLFHAFTHVGKEYLIDISNMH